MRPSSALGKRSLRKISRKALMFLRAITMNTFTASAVLALESVHTEEDFSAEIHQGLGFLKGVQAQNLVAEQAIKVLEGIIKNK